MLGSIDAAQDAVQQTWLRVNRSDVQTVNNMRAWLTTVVSRICLDMLRSPAARREQLTSEAPPEMTSVGQAVDPQEVLIRPIAADCALGPCGRIAVGPCSPCAEARGRN